MRNFNDFVQKLPYIPLCPINNRVKQNLVLAVDAAHLALFYVRELVLIEILHLSADALLLPILKLVHVPRELPSRHLNLVALASPYGFGLTDTRADNLALAATLLEVSATPANLHRRQHLHPLEHVIDILVNLYKLDFGVIFTDKPYHFRRVNARRTEIDVHRHIAQPHHVI